MPYKLLPPPPPDSLLRQICPTLGPVCKTNWAAGHIERNRRIYDYELVFFSSGKGRVLTENGAFLCSAGTVVVIPPGLVHCTVSESETERWCIHFDWYGDCLSHTEELDFFVYMDEASFHSEFCAKPPPEPLKIHFPLFRQLDKSEVSSFRHLVQEFFRSDRETRGGELKQQGLFYTILGRVLEEAPAAAAGKGWKNSRFLTAKNRIDSSFSDPELNCTALAESIGISTNHLTKLFRAMTGLSTQEYLTMRRLEHARELLSGTTGGIAEIVEQCGFSDANYFSRCFRKHHGMSPTQFREKFV